MNLGIVLDGLTGIRYELEPGGIAVVTLSRPERRNAFTLEMWDSLAHVGRTVRDDASVRVVLVKGDGPSFCTGVDLDALDQAFSPGVVRTRATRAQDAYNWLEDLAVPSIAVVHGACIGGGLELALACDVRVVDIGATFSLPEVQMGFVPDLGGASRLAGVVGRSRAKELVWTGRRFGAEDAASWGLADHVTPAGEAEAVGRQLAHTISAADPLAVRYTKLLIDSVSTTTSRTALALTAQMADTGLTTRRDGDAGPEA